MFTIIPNKTLFQQQVEALVKEAAKTNAGSSNQITFNGGRRSVFDIPVFEELYAASGTSTMESAGKISLSRDENIINVNGYVDFHLYDIYDWHKGLKAILRTGVYDDSDAQLQAFE